MNKVHHLEARSNVCKRYVRHIDNLLVVVVVLFLLAELFQILIPDQNYLQLFINYNIMMLLNREEKH